MPSKQKMMFVCGECGYDSPKWYGRCPSCGAWNTMEEFLEAKEDKKGPKNKNSRVTGIAVSISDFDAMQKERITTNISELDRVLGGGMVEGSIVLIGGAPGIGKSTLLLQVCANLSSKEKVLYISGEESGHQIKLRAKRLNIDSDNIMLFCETDIEEIINEIEIVKPKAVVLDSIQTVRGSQVNSAPGSVSQLRACAQTCLDIAKKDDITFFLVGHITKEGAIAGPKVLEHMVDCVLYFEGEKNQNYRIIRAEKNRFGSANEIGVFEMSSKGLLEVENPSAVMLDGRPKDASGTCISSVMEGTRPILCEIQALITPAGYAASRRMCSGFDYNRAVMLIAILEKRCQIPLATMDAYINVVGGLNVDEPAADLAVSLAIASSAKDRPLPYDLIAFGEVGLGGELRAVASARMRINEAIKLGFKKIILPEQNRDGENAVNSVEIYYAKTLKGAIDLLF